MKPSELMAIPLPIFNFSAPAVALAHLDELWFQVGGTLCNLECRHCFISCSPKNYTFGFLDLETFRKYLIESVELGVKEYYFTGGEPFLNRDIVSILELALRYGPTTVLTNGTILKEEWLERLKGAEAASLYSLEFRVSIDGFTPEDNDPIRGPGSFDRAINGVQLLVKNQFLPIITVTRTAEEQNETALFHGFVQMLRKNGYDRPRVKILPTLRNGAEAVRSRPYYANEQVTPEMMNGFDQSLLICNHSRIVTDRGVFVCPILVEAPDAQLGATLAESLGPYSLRHHACHTCYQSGTICANASSQERNI
jgi:sulfatase maturation enzyme AslB (radical SAM superfamily)